MISRVVEQVKDTASSIGSTVGGYMPGSSTAPTSGSKGGMSGWGSPGSSTGPTDDDEL